MKCRTEKCNRDGDYRGWCSYHYDEYRSRNKGPCAIPDCARNAQTRGLCQVHYVAWYRRERPEKVMDTRLRRLYGISLEMYAVMYQEQNGVCAICGQQEKRAKEEHFYPLAVDHDPITGAVRGLLCNQCNTGIGLLQHSITLCEKAILYLNKKPRIVRVEINPEDMLQEINNL